MSRIRLSSAPASASTIADVMDQPADHASAPTLPKAFHRLAASSLTANLAEQVSLAAAPLVAVLTLGSGASGTGLLQAAQTLPFLLLSIPAGLLADRTSRHRLMAMAESVRLLALLAIFVLLLLDRLTFPLLAGFGFLGATGTVVFSVCTPALTPSLVPRASLGQANRMLELVRSVTYIGGPALGGVLVGWTGARPAYAVAAMLSTVAVMLLAGIREPARVAASKPPTHPIEDLREGARFLFHHALLRPLFFTAVFFNFGFFMLMGVYVVWAHDHLHLSAAAIGVTLALYGAGMLAGAALAGRILRTIRFGVAVCIGPLMGLTAMLVMATTIVVPHAWLAGLAFFLIGAGPIVWTITTTTLRQAVTPDALLGRVSSVILTATMGARPVGAALGAAITRTISIQACLLVAVLAFAIQAAIILRTAPARLGTLEDAQAGS
ncbi:MAG: MFS transporter [Thermomicrobiales bacterium]